MLAVLLFLLLCMAVSWVLVEILKWRDRNRYRQTVQVAVTIENEPVKTLAKSA